MFIASAGHQSPGQVMIINAVVTQEEFLDVIQGIFKYRRGVWNSWTTISEAEKFHFQRRNYLSSKYLIFSHLRMNQNTKTFIPWLLFIIGMKSIPPTHSQQWVIRRDTTPCLNEISITNLFWPRKKRICPDDETREFRYTGTAWNNRKLSSCKSDNHQQVCIHFECVLWKR